MNDSLGMSCVKRIGDLDGYCQDAVPLHRTPTNYVLQRPTFQELHRNEGLITLLADFVDSADVGMIQSRGSTSFPAKSFKRLRIFGQFIGQKLQRDEAAKLGVLSLIDHTHPAAAELFEDVVVGDCLADHPGTPRVADMVPPEVTQNTG